MQKICVKCQRNKEHHARGMCKACYWIVYNAEHPEYKDKKRKYDREHARIGRALNADKYNERNRRWYHRHKNDPGFKDKHRAYAKAYWPVYYQRLKRRKILEKIQNDKAVIHHSVLTGAVPHHRPNNNIPSWRRIGKKIFKTIDKTGH